MSHRFIYLIGAPGSGKSSVAATLRAYAADFNMYTEPIPHLVMSRGGLPWYAELGVVRGSFSGTDGLAMDIITKAESWVVTCPYRRLFAEGDRLANHRFFEFVKAAGYELTVVHLACQQSLLDARRASRAAKVGKEQNATWLRGRENKVLKLAQETDAVVLDGAEDPRMTAAKLKTLFG